MTGRVEYAGDRFTFTSVTGYIESDFSRAGELDFASTDFLTEDIETIERTSFSQEFRLQSNNAGQFNWSVGGLYAVDEKDEFESINLGAQNGFGLPDGFPIELLDRDEEVTSYAVFLDLTWGISDRLTLSAGGRFTRDEIDLSVNEVSFGAPSPTLSDKLTFDDFSPTVHAVYQLNETANLYARIAKGWKSGGFELDPQDSSRDDFGEETLWSYEVGYKAALLDRKVNLSLAAFYIDWSDVQVTEGIFFVDAMGNIVAIPDTSNAASATSTGIEFELFALPNPSLELALAVGYNDAEFDKFESASTNSGDVDLSGQPLPRAPEWSASADAQYNIALANDWDAFIRGEFIFKDEIFNSVNNIASAVIDGIDFPFRVPSYSKFNFRTGIENERYRVVAYVENAFDEDYYTTSFDFGFVNGAAVYPSFRSWGIQFTAKWQ